MGTKAFVYLWEYTVKDTSREEFERVYGPSGAWVQLFKKAKGYLGTDLHRDQSNPLRYITVDRWATKGHRDAFRILFSEEFEDLDARCETFTVRENFLGDFDSFYA
jgi:quinol monooxygenase YgiN